MSAGLGASDRLSRAHTTRSKIGRKGISAASPPWHLSEWSLPVHHYSCGFGIRTAVFLNNITACYFSRDRVWATPYELLHGKPFSNASIVVHFGCAALVLLDQQDLAKFKNRCALTVFIHYADEHPLYTYAFYSPRTKRVIFRQDCIVLPTIFPMRKARQVAGMIPNGEQIFPFRSPLCMRGESDSAYSFEGWSHPDPLPAYEDHVMGVKLTRPSSDGTSFVHPASMEENLDPYFPSHPAFGPQSVVPVRPPTYSVG
jgi:hypothetical protein